MKPTAGTSIPAAASATAAAAVAAAAAAAAAAPAVTTTAPTIIAATTTELGSVVVPAHSHYSYNAATLLKHRLSHATTIQPLPLHMLL